MRRIIATLSVCWLCGSAYAATGVFWDSSRGVHVSPGAVTNPIGDELTGTNYLRQDWMSSGLTFFKVTGKEPSTAEITNGTYATLFAGNANNAAVGSIHLGHSWRAGARTLPHVHVVQQGTNVTQMVMKLQWSWFNRYTNGHVTVAADTVTGTCTITNAARAYPENVEWNFDTIYPTNMLTSSQFNFYIERMADDDADTNASALFVLDFDLHSDACRIGEVQ